MSKFHTFTLEFNEKEVLINIEQIRYVAEEEKHVLIKFIDGSTLKVLEPITIFHALLTE